MMLATFFEHCCEMGRVTGLHLVSEDLVHRRFVSHLSPILRDLTSTHVVWNTAKQNAMLEQLGTDGGDWLDVRLVQHGNGEVYDFSLNRENCVSIPDHLWNLDLSTDLALTLFLLEAPEWTCFVLLSRNFAQINESKNCVPCVRGRVN